MIVYNEYSGTFDSGLSDMILCNKPLYKVNYLEIPKLTFRAGHHDCDTLRISKRGQPLYKGQNN